VLYASFELTTNQEDNNVYRRQQLWACSVFEFQQKRLHAIRQQARPARAPGVHHKRNHMQPLGYIWIRASGIPLTSRLYKTREECRSSADRYLRILGMSGEWAGDIFTPYTASLSNCLYITPIFGA
jgi:hypothetical protein